MPKRRLFLILGLMAWVGAAALVLLAKPWRAQPGASAGGEGISAPPAIDPEPVSELEADGTIESFEKPRKGIFHWGGGNIVKEHASHGSQSFRVSFGAEESEGFFCRQGSIPRDFSRHRKLLIDVTSPAVAFTAALVLAGLDQDRSFLYRDVAVPLGSSVLEFDLEAARREGALDLERVGSLQFVCAGEAKVVFEVYFDHIRLSHDSPASQPRRAGEPGRLADSGFIADGEFDAGFSFWRVEPIPGGPWMATIAVGPATYRSGRAMLLSGVVDPGGIDLVGSEMALPPGAYRLELAVRGSGTVRFQAHLEELREQGWAQIRRENSAPMTPSADWVETAIDLAVLPGDPEPRIARLRLSASGLGDLAFDAIALRSRDGHAPPPVSFEAASGSGSQAPGKAPRLRWGGSGFRDGGRPIFPVLYRHRDVLTGDRLRAFAAGCRDREIAAAVDLGGALRAGDLDLALHRARSRQGDPRVAAWILGMDADRGPAPLVAAEARGLARVLWEEDERPVAAGLHRGARLADALRFSDAADVLIAGGPPGDDLDSERFQAFEDAIATCRAAAGGTQPVLARLDAAGAAPVLRLEFHLALIQRAAGLLFDLEEADGRPINWEGAQEILEEARRHSEALGALQELPVESSLLRLRLLLGEAGGRRLLIAANPTPDRIDAAVVRYRDGVETVSLPPWGSRIIELIKP